MEKIDRVMAQFRTEMLSKFHEREAEGCRGWDIQPMWATLVNKLFTHVKEKPICPTNLIDIALLCMFLWNLETEE